MTRSVVETAETQPAGLRPAPVRLGPDPGLLAKVLRPYKDDCRYLKSATVVVRDGLAVARGEFNVPEPCYVYTTPHVNAAELNICYDQLAYYLIAKSIKERAVPALAAWTIGDYWVRQLPNILITRFRSVYRSQICSPTFSGEVAFTSFTESHVRRPVLLTETTCRFWDHQEGRTDGEVLLALVDPPGVDPAEPEA